MSNPQDPSQPGHPDAGPQQPPLPARAPLAQPPSGAVPNGAPQDEAMPDGALQDGAPQDGAPQDGAQAQPEPYAARGRRSQPGPFGLPGTPPPAKSRKGLWITLGVVGGVVVLAVIGIIVLFSVFGDATNKARDLADGFTKLVIAGESSEAYDRYLDPALKEQLSKEDFIAGVASLEMKKDTCTPAYNGLNVSSDNGTNTAEVSGVIDCGAEDVDLAYRFEGTDDLKMTKISLRPKA